MYLESLSTSKPGLIIIMIDQSGSMSDSYANLTKANFAALAVNRVIAELITACTSGDEIKDRAFVAVIGYGAKVNVLFLDKVSVLAKNTNTITLKKHIPDGAGGLVEVDEILPIFVNPTASGGTPMTEAFQQAYVGAEKFISNNPNSFPPIVINITDGEPNSFDTAMIEARKVTQLKTTNGNVIILNIHISNGSEGKIELPNNNIAFSGNKLAQFLFDISSVLPEPLAESVGDKLMSFDKSLDSKDFSDSS